MVDGIKRLTSEGAAACANANPTTHAAAAIKPHSTIICCTSRAHGHFPFASFGPRHEQVRKIRAGDEQNQPGHEAKNPQRLPEL
jgi:hypothetical protein